MTKAPKGIKGRSSYMAHRRARSQEILARCASKVSNEAALENGMRFIKQIWDIVGKALTEDRRAEKKKYFFLVVQSQRAHHAAKTLGLPEEYVAQDPNAALVVSKRVAFAAQPNDLPLWRAIRKRRILGYIDVVLTAERFEFFGVRYVNGSYKRNNKPFLTSEGIDSFRPDSLDLGALYKRLNKMLPARTVG